MSSIEQEKTGATEHFENARHNWKKLVAGIAVAAILAFGYSVIVGPDGEIRNCIKSVFGDPASCSDGEGGDRTCKFTCVNKQTCRIGTSDGEWCSDVYPDGSCASCTR